MQEFFRTYFPYMLDVFIFIMVFIWFYFGNGGTHDNKTKFGRYGIPSVAGVVVLLVVFGLGKLDAHWERGKCRDLPAGEGVMSNDRCYKRIDGPVYVPVNTQVFTEQ
jgi:hypothetical protein